MRLTICKMKIGERQRIAPHIYLRGHKALPLS
jgi:hypothetical protein